MSLSTVVKNILKYLILGLGMTKMSVLSAMEYRLSFVMQVLGMMINNMAFIVIWAIYFGRFGSINGWTQYENLLLQGVVAISFGLVMIFAGGSRDIANKITNGGLDYYLSLPKNPLWHILVSKTLIFAIGDFIFGVLMLILAGNFDIIKIIVAIIVSILSAVVFLSFTVLTQSLAFWFGDFESGATTLFDSILNFSLYPQTIFQGVLKFITIFVIPGFFMANLPVSLITNFSWINLLQLSAFSVFIATLSIFVFNKGLKRYESGSLIGVNG